MSAFLYSTLLQWKLDIRNKGILVTYYIIPLIFFLFMGGMMTSIMPDAYKTLTQSMTVFGVTMGAVLGAPTTLVELYGSDVKKAYCVGGIPLWTAAVSNFVSAFMHLMVMSIFIFFVGPIIFDAAMPSNLWAYFPSLALMIAASISIGTLLGIFVKSASKLTMVSQFLFLPSIMLSGIMFPTEMLPKALLYVGMLFPATWGYQLMCAENFDLSYVLPLLAIIITILIVSTIKLKRMKNE